MNSHKILLVDDEPHNIRILRNYLAAADGNYTLYQAFNGELALKIGRNELPDLIITDWEMPGMDGLDLIRNFSQDPLTAEIPVIMCTGVMTSSENLRMAFLAGAVDYIRKPVDEIELVARVRSMLLLSDSRKEHQREFRMITQQNQFISQLIEDIPNPLVLYESGGKIRKYNRKFAEISVINSFGNTEPTIYQLFDPENTGSPAARDQLLIKGGAPVSYKFNWAERSFLISKTLLRLPDSPADVILCVMTDITELEKAHLEIEENKKHELTSAALRLVQIMELNNQLISDLESFSAFTTMEGKELVRQMLVKSRLSSGERFWNEFETRFDNLYESFSRKLSMMYPGLTPGDRKLCALLRLNLSSKDIAAIVHQNPQSIDMARYRLRKKMNLEPGIHLVDYLLGIE